ncbi:hypothetical protein BH23DEI1_BH23DEI1_21960 [soil metagenome]
MHGRLRRFRFILVLLITAPTLAACFPWMW